MSSSRAIAGARQRRAGEPVSAANYVQQQQSQPQQPQRQPQQYNRQQNNVTINDDESNNMNGSIPSGKVPLPYAVMILSARLNELESKMNSVSTMSNYSSLTNTNTNTNNELNNEVVDVVNSIAEKVDFLEQVIYKIDNEKITELEKKVEDSKNIIIQLQMMIMEINKQVLGFMNMAHQSSFNSVSVSLPVPVPVPELVLIKENKENKETQQLSNNTEQEPEQNNISTESIQPQITMEINELNVNA